jgi:hypothetical protein
MATKRKPKEAPRLFGPPLERPSTYKGGKRQEELEYMRDCEAREWIRRYKEKVSTIGSVKAASWWTEVLLDLQRIRGESATLDLRQRMRKQSENRT